MGPILIISTSWSSGYMLVLPDGKVLLLAHPTSTLTCQEPRYDMQSMMLLYNMHEHVGASSKPCIAGCRVTCKTRLQTIYNYVGMVH